MISVALYGHRVSVALSVMGVLRVAGVLWDIGGTESTGCTGCTEVTGTTWYHDGLPLLHHAATKWDPRWRPKKNLNTQWEEENYKCTSGNLCCKQDVADNPSISLITFSDYNEIKNRTSFALSWHTVIHW